MNGRKRKAGAAALLAAALLAGNFSGNGGLADASQAGLPLSKMEERAALDRIGAEAAQEDTKASEASEDAKANEAQDKGTKASEASEDAKANEAQDKGTKASETQEAAFQAAEAAFQELAAEHGLYGALTGSQGIAVRKSPSEQAETACVLPSGYQARISEASIQDGGLWFLAWFARDGVESCGYVREEDFVTQDARLGAWKGEYLERAATISAYTRAASGKTDLNAFPSSYRASLKKLIAAHPAWTFVPMETGLQWADVLQNEMADARNLVELSSPVTWKSTAAGDYDGKAGTFTIKNGTSWVQASEAIVKYYLDPRNFLNEDAVFQFEQLTYNSAYHTEAGVEKILSGTFMGGKKLEDGSGGGITYAQAFLKIGKELNVSPYFLASRVRQEQGVKGTSALISGKEPGYEGYYNYFNREATGVGADVITNGLKAAKEKGWNTRYKSLSGGAESVSADYIQKGQDTLYLQKFDVDASYSGLYWHQYMQNLSAAESEGKSVKNSYALMGALGNPFVFKVPVYGDMPSSACAKPGDKLGKPSLTAEKSGETSAALSWKKVAGAYGYQIYRKEGENGSFAKIKTITGADKLTYTDNAIVPGKTYYYKVRAYLKLKSGNQYSAYSAERSVDYAVPKTSWKSLEIGGYTSVSLTWAKRAVDGYKIYRRTDTGKYSCIQTVKGKDVKEYEDTSVQPGHRYSYKIRSYKKIGGKTYYSAYTKERTAEPVMARASLKKAKFSGKKKVALSWKRDKKASGYYIYRADSKKGKYKKIKTISKNQTVTWTDTGVKAGKTYYYKIRSYVKTEVGRAYSAYSKEKAASK